jgi:hypothetical protein
VRSSRGVRDASYRRVLLPTISRPFSFPSTSYFATSSLRCSFSRSTGRPVDWLLKGACLLTYNNERTRNYLSTRRKRIVRCVVRVWPGRPLRDTQSPTIAARKPPSRYLGIVCMCVHVCTFSWIQRVRACPRSIRTRKVGGSCVAWSGLISPTRGTPLNYGQV